MIQKTIKIFGKPLTLSMRDDGDQAVANEVFRDREYSSCDEVIRGAKQAVIDVGGHAGFFSLYAAILNPKVPIYAFEPASENYKLLKQNLKGNRIRNVTPKNQAVWKTVGEVELKLSAEGLNHSMVHAIETVNEVERVNATTLEKIIQKNRLKRVDLLKMDCEGAEFDILFATPQATFDKLSTIYLEYHDWVPGGDHHKLKQHLENMGFKVRDFPNHKMRELGFLWCTK